MGDLFGSRPLAHLSVSVWGFDAGREALLDQVAYRTQVQFSYDDWPRYGYLDLIADTGGEVEEGPGHADLGLPPGVQLVDWYAWEQPARAEIEAIESVVKSVPPSRWRAARQLVNPLGGPDVRFGVESASLVVSAVGTAATMVQLWLGSRRRPRPLTLLTREERARAVAVARRTVGQRANLVPDRIADLVEQPWRANALVSGVYEFGFSLDGISFPPVFLQRRAQGWVPVALPGEAVGES